MAQIPGGVRVAGFMSPTDDTDVYATHKSIYGYGGYREVANAAARIATPAERQAVGMLVYQADTDTIYKLDSMGPAVWSILSLGGEQPDYNPKPDYWSHLPLTRPHAIRALAYWLSFHISDTLDPVSDTSTGWYFTDFSTVWTGGDTPETMYDALETIAKELYNHISGQITCAGTGVHGPSYSGSTTYWTNVPATVDEAIDCIAAELYTHLGALLPVGPETFLGLSDTPFSYTGHLGKMLTVGSGKIEFSTNPFSLGTATGDLLYYNITGSTWTKLAAGANTYILTSNGPGTAPSWQVGGSGEVNSGLNVGGGTFSIYKDKLALNLRFKTISAGSNKLSIVENSPTDTLLTLDVAEGNIVHQNLNGAGTRTHAELDSLYTAYTTHVSSQVNSHSQIDSHINSTSNPHSVTPAQVQNTSALWNANQLQGRTISTGAPGTNDVLTWTGSQWAPQAPGGIMVQHPLGGATWHSSSTLASVNSLISDATLDTNTASRPPTAHSLSGAEHSSTTLSSFTGKISDVSQFITSIAGEFVSFGNIVSATADRILVEDASNAYAKGYMRVDQLNHQHLSGAGTRTHSELDTLYTNYYAHIGVSASYTHTNIDAHIDTVTGNPHAISLQDAYDSNDTITTGVSGGVVIQGTSSPSLTLSGAASDGLYISNATANGLSLNVASSAKSIEMRHNATSSSVPGLYSIVTSTNSSSPAAQLISSSTNSAATQTLLQLNYYVGSFQGMYTGILVDFWSGNTSISSTKTPIGLSLAGQTNSGTGQTVGLNIDSRWDVGAVLSSNMWHIDNVFSIYGSNLESGLFWNSTTDKINMYTTGSARDILLSTSGSESHIELQATSGNIDIDGNGVDINAQSGNVYVTASSDIALQSGGVFDLETTGSTFFTFHTSANVVIRMYIQSTNPGTSGVPNGSIWIDTSSGQLKYLLSGTWTNA